MTRDEFVRMHGEQVWNLLVVPLSASANRVAMDNAGLLTHAEIMIVAYQRFGLDTSQGLRSYDRNTQYGILQLVIENRSPHKRPVNIIA